MKKSKEVLFKRIYVEITNRCNLQCTFCPPVKRIYQDMTLDKFEQIITKIKPYTNYVYLHLKGEPLIHPQFGEILQICNQYQMNVNLTTNGVHLVKQMELLFESPPIKRINISFQSLINLTDNQRDSYLSNLKLFLKKAALEQKFYLSLRLWNDQNNPSVKSLNQMVIKFLEDIFEVKISTHPSDKPIHPMIYLSQEDEFQWPSLNQKINHGPVKCLGGKQHIAILVDGTVAICCLDQEGITNLGNIFSSSMLDILSSNKYQQTISLFNQNKAYLDLCKHCSYHKRFK